MSDLINIPTIHLKDLDSHDVSVHRAATSALLEAFGTYGLVYVKDHGIDPPLLDALYDDFLTVTQRPESEKRKLGGPDLWFQRGWTPPNTERAVVAGGQPDFKECYFAAPEPLDPVAAREYPQIYADNIWPKDAARFQDSYLTIGHQLHQIGLTLLRSCALGLDLRPYQFEELAFGAPHVARLLRYLPLTQAQVGTEILWGEEHTDFNLLTLLPGGQFFDPDGQRCPRPDDQCGLYLRTRPTADNPQGRMVRGLAPPGSLVVQVGQQLEILTGGTFTATPHIVKPPTAAGYTRVAMAHFIHVHAHRLLHPLPNFRTDEAIDAYRPAVLAGTYGTKTLVDIGLAPPSALDQLGYRHYDRLDQMRKP